MVRDLRSIPFERELIDAAPGEAVRGFHCLVHDHATSIASNVSGDLIVDRNCTYAAYMHMAT